jgi:hypothetical protein
VLDDLQPVREMTSTITSAPAHLFAVQDAVRWRRGEGNWASDYGSFANPPRGASIYYYLKDETKEEVKIEILDSGNRAVRTLSSVPRPSDRSDDEDDTEELKKAALPKGAGLHRAVWDLTWEGAKKIKGAKIDTGDPIRGPKAVPGTYTVRLTVGKQSFTSPLKIVPDPRGTVSQADLEAQLAFVLRVRDTISRVSGLVDSMRSVKEQLAARAKALDSRKSEAGIADLLKAGEEVAKRVDALEARLHNPKAEVTYDILAQQGGARPYSRLSPLQMWAIEGDGAPTEGMKQVLEGLEKEIAAIEPDITKLLEQDVAEINTRAQKLGLAFIVR